MDFIHGGGTKKDRKLRVSLDPKDLNKAVLREHYQLPTIEDISLCLAGAKIFTILDIKKGFWHMSLDEESSLLTTFNTPFGRFRWKRLPYSIKMAPEIFQRAMHKLIEGLNGTEVIADDFLIFRSNVREHDTNLHMFLKRCEERNVVLNFDKLQLRQDNVPFIGHVATAEGLKAALEKVNAILHMPQPTKHSQYQTISRHGAIPG